MAYSSWSVIFGEQPSSAKWNILGTNDAHFYTFLGDNVNWQTWAPTLTNLSGGAITYAKFGYVGKTVFFRFKYTLGGAGVAGSVDVTFPVTATLTTTNELVNGVVSLTDTGGSSQNGQMTVIDNTKFRVQATSAAGTYTTATNLTSLIPFTWGNTDVIYCAGSYEAA